MRWTTKTKATRLETWAMPGVPDVVFGDEHGRLHFVELKSSSGKAVDLSPHQVSWLDSYGRLGCSVWILVRKAKTKTLPAELFLFRGTDAVRLKMDGLDAVEPVWHAVGKPFDLTEALDLISPG